MKFDTLRNNFKNRMFDDNRITNMFVANDALSAKIAEKLGYKAIFAAGYATSASNLGLPDRGITDFDTMLNKCREIINATNIPVFADADTGYGDLDNVRRTIKNYEAIGAAGVFLEDQQWPKRCGHMDGKKIEPTKSLMQKIAAAKEARTHNDFLVMARTDARAIEGLKSAIQRCRWYKSAGADMLFIEAPQSINELKEIKEKFPNTPLMVNMIEGGKTPDLTTSELYELGYSIAVHPTASVYTEASGMEKMLNTLSKEGTTKSLNDQMITFDRFNHFIGLDELNAYEDKYSNDKMKKKLAEWELA